MYRLLLAFFYLIKNVSRTKHLYRYLRHIFFHRRRCQFVDHCFFVGILARRKMVLVDPVEEGFVGVILKTARRILVTLVMS